MLLRHLESKEPVNKVLEPGCKIVEPGCKTDDLGSYIHHGVLEENGGIASILFITNK